MSESAPMRLTDLQPVWLTDGPGIVGVLFNCPCAKCRGDGCKLGVRFANPTNGVPPTPNDEARVANNRGRRWVRIGDSFETLSIQPSIDATKDRDGNDLPREQQHWHGFITNGVAQ